MKVTPEDIIDDIARATGHSNARVKEAAMFQFKMVARSIRTMKTIRLPYWGVYKPLPNKVKDDKTGTSATASNDKERK